jgi:hypothetical protein
LERTYTTNSYYFNKVEEDSDVAGGILKAAG